MFFVQRCHKRSDIFKCVGYGGGSKIKFSYIHLKINKISCHQLLKTKILRANLSLDPQVV